MEQVERGGRDLLGLFPSTDTLRAGKALGVLGGCGLQSAADGGDDRSSPWGWSVTGILEHWTFLEGKESQVLLATW